MLHSLLVRSVFLAFTIFAFLSATRAADFNIPNGDIAALKSAIVIANGNGQTNNINLASGGSYVLTSVDNAANGLPVISGNLTINGNGAILQRSAGAGTAEFRLLQLSNGASLSCNDLTISRGRLSGGFPGN